MRVYTAPVAAAAWLRAQQIRTVAVYVAAATDVEFAAFQRDATRRALPRQVLFKKQNYSWMATSSSAENLSVPVHRGTSGTCPICS